MAFDYTYPTARTHAQKRDAILIANMCGPVRRALNYKVGGSLDSAHSPGVDDRRLANAIVEALKIAKVCRVRIDVVTASDIGRAVFISPDNVDQYGKVAQVMRALGFETKNAHHYTLTQDMQQQGFSL